MLSMRIFDALFDANATDAKREIFIDNDPILVHFLFRKCKQYFLKQIVKGIKILLLIIYPNAFNLIRYKNQHITLKNFFHLTSILCIVMSLMDRVLKRTYMTYQNDVSTKL